MVEPGAKVGRHTRDGSDATKADTSLCEATVGQRFEEQAHRLPGCTAIVAGGESLSYAELDRAANRVANAALPLLGGAREPVGLLLDAGIPWVIGLLGTLKAGRPCVPLEPSYPRARLDYILRDSEADLVLADSAHAPLARSLAGETTRVLDVMALDDATPCGPPPAIVTPDALACILYTSGSTGEPKGIMQSHRYLLHAEMRYAAVLDLRPGDRLMRPTSFAFAGGVRAVLGALLNGATFVIPPGGAPEALAGVLAREGVTVCHLPPAALRLLMDSASAGCELPRLRVCYVASDKLYWADVDRFRRIFGRRCRLIHALAITEAGAVRRYVVGEGTRPPGDVVPVGYPEQDMEILILDDDRRPVAAGEPGEIAVRSRYISLGYWRRPELTEAVFQPDPEGGDRRTYLTGDLGRMLPDGCLVHLGRKDFQGKVRGYRVDVAEVEAALRAVPGLREAAAMIRADDAGDARVVAYAAFDPARKPTVTELRSRLAAKLPDYMVPGAFVFMDRLPMTPSGKVDRSALPPPGPARPDLAAPYTAPRTPIEDVLASVWAQALGVSPVGVHDSFVDLGGHSLKAALVVSRIRELLRVDVPIRTVFERGNVGNLALAILEKLTEQAGRPIAEDLLAELGRGGTEPLVDTAGDGPGKAPNA